MLKNSLESRLLWISLFYFDNATHLFVYFLHNSDLNEPQSVQGRKKMLLNFSCPAERHHSTPTNKARRFHNILSKWSFEPRALKKSPAKTEFWLNIVWLLISAKKWCATVCMSYRSPYCWFVVILTVNWFKSVATQPLNPSDALGTRVNPGWVIDYFPPNETVYLSQERRIALIRAYVTRVQRRLLAASIDDILISVQVLLQSYKSGLKTWACFQRRVIL